MDGFLKQNQKTTKKITLVHECFFMVKLTTFLWAACLKEHTYNDV